MRGCQPEIGDERMRSPSAILPTKEMSAATVGGTKLLRPWTDARPYTLLNDARVAVMGAPRGATDIARVDAAIFFRRVPLTKRLRSAAQSNPTCIRRGGLKVADRRCPQGGETNAQSSSSGSWPLDEL